jgi:hypothetical protein
MRNTINLYKTFSHPHKVTQNNTPIFGSSVPTVREQVRNKTGVLDGVTFKWPLGSNFVSRNHKDVT